MGKNKTPTPIRNQTLNVWLLSPEESLYTDQHVPALFITVECNTFKRAKCNIYGEKKERQEMKIFDCKSQHVLIYVRTY
jgi:hypothetical protein